MMDALYVAVLSTTGLAVGSFLAVCIHRLPRRQSVATPASHCPACARTLRWIEAATTDFCNEFEIEALLEKQ